MTLRALVWLLFVTAGAIGQAVPMPVVPAWGFGHSRGRSVAPSTSFLLEIPEFAQAADVTVYVDNRHGRRFRWNAIRLDVQRRRPGGRKVISPHVEFPDFAPMAASYGPGGLFVAGWDERDGASRLERWDIELAGNGLTVELRVDRVPITSWFDAAPTLDIAVLPHVDEIIVLSGFVDGSREAHRLLLTTGERQRLDIDASNQRSLSVFDLHDGAVALAFSPQPIFGGVGHPNIVALDEDRNGAFDRSETVRTEMFYECFYVVESFRW